MIANAIREDLMFTQEKKKPGLRKLVQRREYLRSKLKEHFSTPVTRRDYREFESIVDELDELRQLIRALKEN